MVPYGRLARQPDFEGAVTQGRDYVLVDDFVGMGGTLANLRGFIEAQGGKVVAAVTLTGKPYSAKLALDAEQLQELREKHGTELETWWQENFNHAYTALLNQKLGISPAPRMLTPSEIELLRRSKQEMAEAYRTRHHVESGGEGRQGQQDEKGEP